MSQPGPRLPRCGGPLAAVGLVVASLAACGEARALINPRFTPVHLVRDSGRILAATPVRGPGPGEWRLTRATGLKGPAGEEGVLDLSACRKDQANAVRKVFEANGGAAVLLFCEGGKKSTKAYVSVAGTWLAATRQGPRRWAVTSLVAGMSGTYAGGTDMLVRMVRYVLASPNADVPVSVGASWTRHPCRIGHVKGAVTGMAAFQPAGVKGTYLFVASGSGDRLYRSRDDEAFDDVTVESGLEGRSARFVWADTDRDGRIELLGLGPNGCRLRELDESGRFSPPQAGPAFGDPAECLGLAVCSRPADGSPGVLVSTAGRPILHWRDKDGRWGRDALPGGGAADLAGNAVCACVVADLDGDGYGDVLQPGPKAGVLWRGGGGGFGEAQASTVTCGVGPGRLAVADFNQDGALDVFLSDARGVALWENDGRGGFACVTRWAGSLNYKALGGLSFCLPADLNHDGRTDLCLLHPRDAFTYHFNRGFRCFGEEGGLRLADPAGAAGGLPGQSACAVADFNDDGSLDLAVGFGDGRVYCFYNDAFGKPLVRVGLAPGAAGPVTVSAWQGGKFPLCVGARSVAGPVPGAWFALGRRRNVTFRWRRGGGGQKTKTLPFTKRLLDRSATVVLE